MAGWWFSKTWNEKKYIFDWNIQFQNINKGREKNYLHFRFDFTSVQPTILRNIASVGAFSAGTLRAKATNFKINFLRRGIVTLYKVKILELVRWQSYWPNWRWNIPSSFHASKLNEEFCHKFQGLHCLPVDLRIKKVTLKSLTAIHRILEIWPRNYFLAVLTMICSKYKQILKLFNLRKEKNNKLLLNLFSEKKM
jgi:hypothetical protein